jgi:hypothetical protein
MEPTIHTLPDQDGIPELHTHVIGNETILSNLFTSALKSLDRTATVRAVTSSAEAHDLIDQGGQLSVIVCAKSTQSVVLDPVKSDSGVDSRYQDVVDMFW